MELGFANALKKRHLVQRGDKTFRHFRMTQLCHDSSRHQMTVYSLHILSKKSTNYNRIVYKTNLIKGTNCHMFWHEGAILRQFINNK